MLFVVSTLVTLGALWVLYTWATEAFPWLARTPRRKRSLAGVLAFLVVANWISDAILVVFHSGAAGLVHSALVLWLAVVVLAAVPVALLRAVSRVVARDGAGAI